MCAGDASGVGACEAVAEGVSEACEAVAEGVAEAGPVARAIADGLAVAWSDGMADPGGDEAAATDLSGLAAGAVAPGTDE